MLELQELQDKTPEELSQIILSLQASQKQFIDKITLQEAELNKRKTLIDILYEQIHLLKHSRYSSSSERYVDDNPQGRLFDEVQAPSSDELDAIKEADESITVPEHQRKKRGRKPLPTDLLRVEIMHDLADEDKQCDCGCELTCIGDVRSEQLEIIPAKMQVLVHIQKKYACKACEETNKTAQKPKQPIPKSIAAPGLLSYVLTYKYQHHMPLYRQEKLFQGIGVDIPRATLSHWVIRCAQLLEPLVILLEANIKGYDVAYSDEPILQVLHESGKPAQSKSYMWCFGGGPPGRLGYVYRYQPNRAHQHGADFFGDYQGYLHCDGYQAYDNLHKVNPKITLAGCWYHVRRKFVDADKVSKKGGLANYVIREIRALSKIEKAIQNQRLSPNAAKHYRQEKATKIINKLKKKLDENQEKASSQSTLGKAIGYALNQWPKLLTYLEDGRLEISNNCMERAIKPFTIGRKNWLFANSVEGANAGAIIYSLVETCKANQIDVYDWLKYALTRLPSCETTEEYEALLPFNFQNQKK